MPNQNESPLWLERMRQRIEWNWERWETRIQTIFAAAGIIFPICFSIGISEGENLNPIVGCIVSLSFWTIVICAILLMRNSGKGTKQRLERIERHVEKLDTTNLLLLAIAQKLGVNTKKLMGNLENRDENKNGSR